MVKALRERLAVIERRMRWEVLRIQYAAGMIATGLIVAILVLTAADLFFLAPMRARLADDVRLVQRELDAVPPPVAPPSKTAEADPEHEPWPQDLATPVILHALLQAHEVDVLETTYDFKTSTTKPGKSGPQEVNLTMPLAGDYLAIRGALKALSKVPRTQLIDIAMIRSHTTETHLAVQLRLAYTEPVQP